MAHLSSLTRLLMLVLLFPSRSGIIPDSTVSTTWTELNASLPNAVKWLIGGYCDITQTIWIFGGSSYPKSVLSFDPNMSSAVVQHNDALNQFPIINRGGILDGRFYFNSPSSPYISLFFTTNVSFVYQFAQHIKGYTDFEILPWTIHTDTSTVLFVLGAAGTNETYILNTSSSNWHQAADYSASRAHAIIVNTHLYRVASYEIQYLDITGSIQDIVSRKWQKSPINDLEYRITTLNAFYNKYSHNYELWAWGGYGPSYQMEGIRIVNTKTFEVTHVATPGVAQTDAMTAYVPYKDAWYVIGGHWGSERDSIYYVTYSAPWEPTSAPSTPTGIPTNGPTSNPTSATSAPTRIPTNPTSAPTRIPTNGPTSAPTRIPTNPTSAPTPSPTMRPTVAILSTFCEDAYGTYTYGHEFSENSNGFCCLRSWSASCGEGCARTQCEAGALGPGSYWILMQASYTCCVPTPEPTLAPTQPTFYPTNAPSTPTGIPTNGPTSNPTSETSAPTRIPTNPTFAPTGIPTNGPTSNPTSAPTRIPTNPTSAPTRIPTNGPTSNPTSAPTGIPTNPTSNPTSDPTGIPTTPTSGPTSDPTVNSSFVPTDGITITMAASPTSISKAGDEPGIDYLTIIGILSALLSTVITCFIIYFIQKCFNRKTTLEKETAAIQVDKADNSDPPPRGNVDQIVVNMQIKEPKDAEDKVAVDDDEALARLIDMGYSPEYSNKALQQNNHDFQKALDWLFKHPQPADSLYIKREDNVHIAADHRMEPEPGSGAQENVMDDLPNQPFGNVRNENNDVETGYTVEGEEEGEGPCDQNDESQSYNDLYLEQKTEKDYDDDNSFDEAVRNAFVSK